MNCLRFKNGAARVAVFVLFTVLCRVESAETNWDTFSDTWVAIDALGRSLPLHDEVGGPRTNRFVAMFYFLWLGQHGQAGPFDITKILAADPESMSKPESSLWGPLHAPHHWGESIWGYYQSDDEAVIRKHAQMLSDAGVDAVIFDVSNGPTYSQSYRALMRAFSQVRSNGGKTPQIAFLCPFGNPTQVVKTLWAELYQPGLHPELWFHLDGKPLILADPAYFSGEVDGVEKHATPAKLEAGQRLGQSFRIEPAVSEGQGARQFRAVSICTPTWQTTNAAVTLTVYAGDKRRVASHRFTNIQDNSWLTVPVDPPQPAGSYYVETSDPAGTIGWWSNPDDVFPRGSALVDGKPVAGDRTIRVSVTGGVNDAIRSFFTFRKPQPDYFQGQTVADQWSWLEIFPQHVFTNRLRLREMISVGVAQNAVSNRLGSMSEPEAKGRSFHKGATDTSKDAVLRGLNFAEQWERALKEDPQYIFVTGWNEWIAGRFDKFNRIKRPVMFVDQFDQEHSRDIEPMKGGHADNYYYQLISNVRRFKGVRPLPPLRSRPIHIDGSFADWHDVEPEFRDDMGDPVHRDHPGWGKAGRYVNQSGRNDIVASKVSVDSTNIYFYVRTAAPLSPHTNQSWMLLYIDSDQNHTNGWLGYDFVLNRTGATDTHTTLERRFVTGWQQAATVPIRFAGNELEVAIPRSALGARSNSLDFKWADNIEQNGDAVDFTINGDVAPNDRFNYRAVFGSFP